MKNRRSKRRWGRVACAAVCVAAVTAFPARAASLADGMDAYDRGDYARAAAIFRPLADAGDTDAKFLLGFMYETGQGVAPDPKTAAYWVGRAAARGFAVAQYYMGFLHATGRGVARDQAEAARWYRRAAEQDYVSALNELAGMYEAGRGVPRDYREAARLYERAVDRGDSELVGLLRLFATPAEGWAGNAPAQYYLGRFYRAGLGVTRNPHRAAEWYRRAADQGIAEARYDLGRLYASGAAAIARSDGAPEPVDAFPRDPVRAHAWLALAATGFGDASPERRDLAIAARDHIRVTMTDAQIAAAERLAVELDRTPSPAPAPE